VKTVRTWILIADGARARVLETLGPGHGVHAVESHVFQGDHSATHDLVSDREGRTYSSHGPGRSAIEARSDPHRELKTQFAHHLAQMLAKDLERGSYDRLLVIAPPVMLGDLRSAITPAVRAKVIGELAKDLTKTPNSEVASHLEGVLVV